MKRTATTIALLVILTTACSPSELIAEQILEGQEGIENVEIDEDTGEVKIEVEGEDGGAIIIGGGDVPDDFAIDVMPGGSVEGVFQQPGGDSVSLTYDASYDEVVAFYQNWVDSTDAAINKFESSDPKQVSWGATDENGEGFSVTVSETSSNEVAVVLITIAGG